MQPMSPAHATTIFTAVMGMRKTIDMVHIEAIIPTTYNFVLMVIPFFFWYSTMYLPKAERNNHC